MSTEDTAAPMTGAPGGSEADDGPGRRFSGRQELGLLVVVALVLALLVRVFLVQAFYIPSQSMEPSLSENDKIVVQKASYWFGSPHRGDVVVFEDPGGWLGPGEQPGPQNPLTSAMSAIGIYPGQGHLVKRVVGVAGDVIECCDSQGRILVNGEALDEGSYTQIGDIPCAGPMTGDCKWVAGPVPDGKIFVMGDNRGASADSTVHLCTEMETDCTDDPYVDTSLVVGKVLAVLWPIDQLGLVENRPDSFDGVLDAP